jgi:hypothetical protein
MALTDMKRLKNPKSKDDIASEPTAGSYYEKYSYGLRINLDDPELEKLKINAKNFEVGSKVSIQANAEIISIRQSADKQSKNRSVELQIVEMSIGNAKGGAIDNKIKGANALKKAGPD